ncbi:MAG: dipeptidase [Bacteroidales bacterium]|jgi:microsomal dipeptidase-like Zn-dependent dipeptidase
MKNLKITPAMFYMLIIALIMPKQLISQNRTEAFLMESAEKIHKKVLTIDTHNDSALRLNNPDPAKPRVLQVTFPYMKQGGLDAAFFAIYIKQGKRDSMSLSDANVYTKAQLKKFKEYTESSRDAAIALNTKDLLRNKRRGVVSVVQAIENGYALKKDVSEIEVFYKMGVRAITLCHNNNNDICDASMDTITEHGGLSEFGIQVVKEMNRLGMLIDLSHSATSTLYDVLEVSSLPVIASHSGVYNIKNHNRNLKDDEIKAIAAKGGLIQVATGGFFLSDKPKELVTVKDIADHIDYVVRLVGIKHVGIGTDFDGGGGVVGLEDASKMKNITIELLRRGYTRKELKLFWGGNLIRLMKVHFL